MGLPGVQVLSERFSERLRKATASVHRRAERTTFIRGFLRGTASPESYIQLLSALLPVYQAMEEESARLATVDPLLARFHFPQLARVATLQKDLRFLTGGTLPASSLTRAFVARIHAVAESEPVRLVGHLYTRYLGDLSGGQVMARIAERSLGLRRGAGLDFYYFDEISDLNEMKILYRERLDELSACSDGGASVIDEAVLSFHSNIQLFDQIQGSAMRSFVRNLPLPWMRKKNR